MGLVSDLLDIVLYQVYPAIESAMPEVGKGLQEEIDIVSGKISGTSSRPLLFGHGSYYQWNSATSVTVMNVTPMQGTDYGVPEVVFVEEGYPEYNMPGPRPFMEKARDQYVDSGKPEQIIQNAIDAMGLN